jgi:mono/diheme cytochrome c family protein
MISLRKKIEHTYEPGLWRIGMNKMQPANMMQNHKPDKPLANRMLGWFGLCLLSVMALSGCGGGASTTANPNTQTQVLVTYTGPAAATDDIRAFQLNFWENLRSDNRCGSCHGNGQDPQFARSDDVNLAYTAALTVVDVNQPDQSAIVSKVRGSGNIGHHCWLASTDACADIITAYIEAWVGGNNSTSSKVIQLTAPALREPGDSKSYPANDADGITSFTTLPSGPMSLHGLLTTNCSGCHVSTSRSAQAPFFAESDAAKAYEELKSSQKIDLDDPANSRVVVRLRNEFHNCWTPAGVDPNAPLDVKCGAAADLMQAAVEAFAATLPVDSVDSSLVYSKALKLSDAIVASGGNRHEANVVALYEFKSGVGNIAYDTSGVEPAMNLTLTGDTGSYDWVRGYGVEFKDPTAKAQASVVSSTKLYDYIKDVGEYSIEAWVVPSNVTQEGPAQIVSYTGTNGDTNFTLGQSLYEYDVLNRTDATGADGGPATETQNETLQATLQHVVVTVDPVGGRKVYVDGQLKETDTTNLGNLTNWSSNYAFVLGNNQGRSRPWSGKIRLLAVHNRALTLEQIQQNFDVGVGQKYLMLFNVSAYTGNVDDYVMFEVSEFDNYSYLFTKPMFINLAATPVTGRSIHIQGMRIGVNGKEVSVGQAYRNMDQTIPATATSDELKAGILLSNIGTVIASQKGGGNDEFFLTFADFNGNTHAYTEATPTPPPVDPGLPAKPQVSDIGVKTFDEINHSMAKMTGVSPLVTMDEYNVLKQQFPSVENINGFLSAHQMAIAQLSIAYCDALVEDSTLRTSFFGSFPFNSAVDSAFGSGDSAAKNQIVDALFNKMIGLPGSGTALSSAPDKLSFKNEMTGYDLSGTKVNTASLYDRLYNGCQTNIKLDPDPISGGVAMRSPLCVQDATRTKAMVKAMCSATLGSAAMLVQ